MAYGGLTDGYEAEEVFYFNDADVFFLELSPVGEEANDVDLVDFIFLAGRDKQGSPFRPGRGGSGSRELDGFGLFLDIIGEVFFGGEDKNGCSAGIHTSRSAVAM